MFGRHVKNFAGVLLVGGFALVLAACSSLGAASKAPTDVQIVVGAPTEFTLQSSLTRFSVGVPYHFVVTNKGQLNHEVMLMRPVEPGQMTMTEMDKMALTMIDEEDLTPQSQMSMDYTFTRAYPEGTMEFACHIAGHYEAGMRLPIVVK